METSKVKNMETRIIVTTPEQIESIIIGALKRYDSEKQNKESNLKVLTINQVAKALHIGHTSVGNLIKNGILKATENNKIRQTELDRYLSNK